MVTPQFPAINVSILRERPAVQRGEPVTISGRVSVLGIGFPAVVRVNLEGPTSSTFSTNSNPTGEYAVAIVPDRDGQFRVTSQVFPLGADLPVVGTLLPPLGQSPPSPLLVGAPAAGERPPQPTSIEIRTPIQVGAPGVTIITEAAPAPAPFVFPIAPAGPPGPAPPPTIIIPAVPEPPPVEEEGPPPVVGGQVTGFSLE